MKLKRLLSAAFAFFLMATAAFGITASAADKVAHGERYIIDAGDGWMFYTGEDNNIIEDYKGTNLYSGAHLEVLRQQLETFREILNSRGTEFVIFIAPNREQVYSDKMPASYGPLTSYTRAQQVTDYLRSAGFRVVYPIDDLKEAVEAYPELDFYYRTDTHWNELGAYVGAKALMAELGIEMPAIEDLTLIPIPHESQDITNFVGRRLTDTGYSVSGYTDHGMQSMEDLEAFVHHTSKTGMDDRKVLMAGDSFSLALYPYIGQEFNDVTACNDIESDIAGLMETVQPDIYIYEVTERLLDMMYTGAGLEAPLSWTIEAVTGSSDNS